MLEDSPALRAALGGLALIVVLALLIWLASVARRDVSLVDRAWSLFIAGAGLVYVVRLPAPGARGTWLIALAWGACAPSRRATPCKSRRRPAPRRRCPAA